LKFEDGPSQNITLQWATYFDASDEAGLSRLYGGIHVQADDFRGRIVGSEIGVDAYALASQYFEGVPEPAASTLMLVAFALIGVIRQKVILLLGRATKRSYSPQRLFLFCLTALNRSPRRYSRIPVDR